MFLFLDTETTGKDNARLVQLAYESFDKKVQCNSYYKPPIPIEIGAMSVHRITNDAVANNAAFADDFVVRGELVSCLSDMILVAHNAQFDVGILKTEGIDVPRYICTLKLAQHILPLQEQYKLSYLYYAFHCYRDEGAVGNAHDAKEDIRMLRLVFDKLWTEWTLLHPEWNKQEAVEQLVKLSMEPMLMKFMPLGKYKGQTFEQVAVRDRDYLNWMMYKMENKGVDLTHTLKHYLHI